MKISKKTFILADITGEFLYISILIGLGYSFASEWETIMSLIESMSTFLSSALLLSVIGYFLWKNRFRLRSE